mgnify:CR=1 FL=1
MRLLLASGLSVLSANSFSRQLRLLGEFLAKQGHDITVAGVRPSSAAAEPIEGTARPKVESLDVPQWDAPTYEELHEHLRFAGVILIGYLSQFPFLLGQQRGPEIFFWYQCSRPHLPRGLEHVTPIPLTETTRHHLVAAGHDGIGVTIPHGVDTEVFSPTSRQGAVGPHPVLCSVGANSFRKRFDALFESFGILLESMPDVRLVLKTDTRNKVGGFDLDVLACKLGISEQVDILTNELSETDLAAVYQSSDLYIHTAEWEGFGIPVIEAMACGLPVVTHSIQGPGEIVPYRELLVEGSDVVEDEGTMLRRIRADDLAAGIGRLLADPVAFARASRLGTDTATTVYDIRLVARQWERVFDATL